MVVYFQTKYHYLRFRVAQWRPQFRTWWSMLRIGLPAGAEFVLFFVNVLIVYGIIRGFGAAAQAGFGVGSRVMQAFFLPVVALAFAVSPVVGQNFGGGFADRVRHSIYAAIGIASGVMAVLAVVAHLAPVPLIRAFSNDPRVLAFGSEYLRIVALNFVASGIVFAASSAFQGLGNTLPPLFSSFTRVTLFVGLALLLSHRAGFHIREIWYLSVATQIFQACLSLYLLWCELGKKLNFSAAPDASPGIAAA